MLEPVVFGDYLLVERISVGGMAEIFKARSLVLHTGERRFTVIKRILPHLAEDGRFLEMFRREAQIMNSMRHPNIAAGYAQGEVNGEHYIAMDHVAGQDLLSLGQYVRRTGDRLPPRFVRYIGALTADALGYAHALTTEDGTPFGLVHRDVSPQNVIVSYDGEIKLIDFGVAKTHAGASKSHDGALKGKVAYMAPEQVTRTPINHLADQFSLGTVLYELLTDTPLFTGDNDLIILEKIREADVPPPSTRAPSSSPELDSILLRMLSREPQGRFADCAEVAKALMPQAERRSTQFDFKSWLRLRFARELADEESRNARFDEYSVSDQGVITKPPKPPEDRTDEWSVNTGGAALGVGGQSARQTPHAESSLLGNVDILSQADPMAATVAAAQPQNRPSDYALSSDEIPAPPPDHTVELPPPPRYNNTWFNWKGEQLQGLFYLSLTILSTALLGFALGELLFPNPPSPAGVIVRVIPRSEVLVEWDGQAIVSNGPVVFSQTHAGTHTLRLEHPKYESYETELELSPGQFLTVEHYMEPLR